MHGSSESATVGRRGQRIRRQLEQLQTSERSYKPTREHLANLQARILAGRERNAAASGHRPIPEPTVSPITPAPEAPVSTMPVLDERQDEAPVIPAPTPRTGPLTPKEREELQSQLRAIRERQSALRSAPTGYDFNSDTPAPVDDWILGSVNQRRRN